MNEQANERCCRPETDPTLGSQREEENRMAATIKVKGMSCQHCVMSIKKALSQLEGIRNVDVDLQKGEVRLENSRGIEAKVIEKAIEEAGYEVVQN